jgi:transposase
MFARFGIELSRSTLCDWVRQAVELLEPIAERIRVEILLSAAIYADETVLKVQDPNRKRT